MAGDWLKMRTDLYRDPKVCVMADHLMDGGSELSRYVDQNTQRQMSVTRNVTRNAVVGSLLSVWGVMRHRGKRDGNDLLCRGVTHAVLDDVADMPGFGDAMLAVGWVAITDEGIVFPNFFESYNVEPGGRERSTGAERQRQYRARKRAESAGETAVTSDVTRDVTRDVTVTHRVEKRKSKNTMAGSRPEYPAEFENAWHLYPKRVGDNPKVRALKAWNARRAEGHTPEEMADGVQRYARFCQATNKVGTEMVKQAATFFGPDKPFRETWQTAPKHVGGFVG